MVDTILHTVRSLSEKHAALNEGGIRWDIFHANTNGLAESGALIRKGRKVILDEARYLECLRNRNGIRPRHSV